MENQYQAALISFPDDRAVENNNGRPGAAGGPAVFREQFKKLKGQEPVSDWLQDMGDITISESSIEESHTQAQVLVRQAHKQLGCSLIIGGGHDYAYPHLAGVKAANPARSIGCINLDPHFDLRPPQPDILSGSPFYMAIENEIMEGANLVEFGIQKHCNAASLWKYAEHKNVETITFDKLRFHQSVEKFLTALNHLCTQVDQIVISLDLDSIQAAYAPGVSAPAAEGFAPSEILEMTAIAARNEQVVSLGIYELNPFFDIDHHTARLASVIAYQFLRQKFTR